MYARQNNRDERAISIPQNYSGNAFSSRADEEPRIDEEISEVKADSSEVIIPTPEPKSSSPLKNILPININSEELIIIGIALLIFQNGDDDGIIPLLLAVLFLGGRDK